MPGGVLIGQPPVEWCAPGAPTFEDGQSITTTSNEDLASLSKLDALLISLEYQKADTVLQLSDLFAQRWLGDLQSVGGTPAVEFFGKSYSSKLKSNLRWRQ
jgi:hypothetical protein